jgi:dolichol kinase
MVKAETKEKIAMHVMLRKALHFLIALSPTLAGINYALTVLLLSFGTLIYAFLESCRFSGVAAPLVSKITVFVSHSRDKRRFVLGPVTLGAGALWAMIFLPREAYTIGIYALAFGDGFAGLVGRIFGRLHPKFLAGKSIEGSLACFIAVFISAQFVTNHYTNALICAAAATVIEAAHTEDFDNILLPLAVGIIAKFIIPL